MHTVHVSKKFLCPALPPLFLHRATLVNKLREALTGITADTYEKLPDYRLVLLYAPAGYGKTTLLADLARHITLPCCWYSLDPSDTDTLAFLKSLIENLRRHFPRLETEFAALIARITAPDLDNLVQTAYINSVVDVLIDLINTTIDERFALVLCNYQEVNESSGVNKIVDRLLRNVLAHCVIVIESRIIPNLNFGHLLAHREVFILNNRDLRFTAQEIFDLDSLQTPGSLSYKDAEQITNAFDGWIAGILLGTHLGGPQFLQVYQNERKYLFLYVVNEVFQHEAQIYLFLKEAAILQQMTPTVCIELLETPDAGQHLAYLEQHGLFVTRHDSDTQIMYTCNPILRELLCEELQRENPQRFLALHERAAHIFLALLDYEQTIYHALIAHVYEMIADLIFARYEELFVQGNVETLKRWIKSLPTSFAASNPRLLLIQANLVLLAGDYTQAFALLDTAEQYYRTEPVHAERLGNASLKDALALARSKALFQAGEYQQACDLCQQTLEHLPTANIVMRADIYLRLGICLNLLGEISSGIVHVQKALQLWGRNTINRQVANAHSALASAYSLSGNFLLAEHHLLRSILCWQELHDDWGKITSLIRRGIIKQRQGAFSEAEKDLAEALKLARAPLYFLHGEAYALANLADLSLEQEQYERALTFAEDSLALAHQLKDNRLIAHCLQTLALAYLLKGDVPTALLFVSDIDTPPDPTRILSYEHAIYAVTYGTVLLYQKHYANACIFLAGGARLLEAMKLKHEYLPAKIRMAACQLALQQDEAFETSLKEIAVLLAEQMEYEHLAAREIHRLPVIELADRRRSATQLFDAQLSLDKTFLVRQDSIVARTEPVLTLPVQESNLRIIAFGDPILSIEGTPIKRWRMLRAMELFFLLLHAKNPLHKEQIITALWPSVDEQTDSTFYTTIYYLRKIIGRECITSHAGFYSLNLGTCYGKGVWYDVDEFQKHHTLGKNALKAEEYILARTELLAMIDLYRGNYLQPFYNNWCSSPRDILRMNYLEARRELGQLAWRSKDWDESLSHWQQMLVLDDCQEEAHSGIIRCYMRLGQRSLALRQYLHCKETLQRELGTKPGPALQSLYQRLMEDSEPL